MKFRQHPHLFEINTWAWLERLSERLGREMKLTDVPDGEWDAIARLGFDAIWLMGVWQRSPVSRRIALQDPKNFAGYDAALPGWRASDVIGSPYSVQEYVPDARIATWDSLAQIRDKLRRLGLALFLDFVGNHTALDHRWTREHPDFYIRATQEEFEKDPASFYPIELARDTYYVALARDPYFPPWKDVAQLNHYNPELRAAQLADLRAISEHCDGVRCDMAMLHLKEIFMKIWGHMLAGVKPPEKEFWTEAHAAVPDLTLLAEAYWGTESYLLELGFSFAYDKEIYDAVRDRNIEGVRTRITANPEIQRRLARFLENHDEARRTAIFGNERLPAVGTLMATLPGMRFYHQGELDGLKVQLPITLRTAAAEPRDPVTEAFFHRILELTREDVFHSGHWNLLDVGPEGDDSWKNLVAYEWRSEQNWKLIVVNLGSAPSQGRVRMGDRVSEGKQYHLRDDLNGDAYPRSGEELQKLGLYVRRDGGQAHFFDVAQA